MEEEGHKPRNSGCPVGLLTYSTIINLCCVGMDVSHQSVVISYSNNRKLTQNSRMGTLLCDPHKDRTEG